MRNRPFKRPTALQYPPQSSNSDRDVLPDTVQQSNATSWRKQRIRKNRTFPLFKSIQIFLSRHNIPAIPILILASLMAAGVILVKHPPFYNAPNWTHRRNTAKGTMQQLSHNNANRGLEVSPLSDGFSILFSNTFNPTKGSDFFTLERFGRHRRRAAKSRFFGGLNIQFKDDERKRVERREIFHDYNVDRGYDDLSAARQDDDDRHDYYYAFDDDHKRNPLVGWSDDRIQDEKTCRRTNWHRDLPINCNSMHEFDIQQKFAEGRSKFVG